MSNLSENNRQIRDEKLKSFARKSLDILGGAILISLIETISHGAVQNLLKYFELNSMSSGHSFSLAEILSHTIEHLPLGILCIVTCLGSMNNSKTYIYMIVGLLLHFLYEGGGENPTINIFIVAMIGEFCAYLYNHKKEIFAKISLSFTSKKFID